MYMSIHLANGIDGHSLGWTKVKVGKKSGRICGRREIGFFVLAIFHFWPWAPEDPAEVPVCSRPRPRSSQRSTNNGTISKSRLAMRRGIVGGKVGQSLRKSVDFREAVDEVWEVEIGEAEGGR